MAGQQVPLDIDTEKSILAECLLYPESFRRVAEDLEPKNFYRTAHQKIFEAGIEVMQSGHPANLQSVTAHMRSTGRLEKVGGAIYLAKLTDCPVPPSLNFAIEKLQELTAARRTFKAAHQILKDCCDRPATALEIAKQRLDSIKVQSSKTGGVEIVSAADIRPEPIDWLWKGYLAAGKVHIFAGPAGTGKTTISISFAATLTAGGRWPDGTRADEAGDVLIWSGEDDPRDTIVPRRVAAGADLRRTHIIRGMSEIGGKRAFDPANDFPVLQTAIAKLQVRMLIVDPVVSAVAGDSHKNAEVRKALQPLVEFAEKCRCAVLGITHFSKGTVGRDPLERVTGSLAFGALARIVLAAAKLPDDEKHSRARLLARVKSNIGPDDGGFLYYLDEVDVPSYPGVTATRLLWGEAVTGTARELFA